MQASFERTSVCVCVCVCVSVGPQITRCTQRTALAAASSARKKVAPHLLGRVYYGIARDARWVSGWSVGRVYLSLEQEIPLATRLKRAFNAMVPIGA